MKLLAILGRGIQRVSESDPPEKVLSWSPTEDLEVCDDRGAHLPVRVFADDNNPLCMVGGGQMNLDAGRILVQIHEPEIVVCAYGNRSGYLASINAPSESEVMSQALRQSFIIPEHPGGRVGRWSPITAEPEIIIWPRDMTINAPSNTGQEVRNVFDLAVRQRLVAVGLVTVGVYLPRTATYVAKHLSRHKEYRNLAVQLFESEEVLLAVSGRTSWWPRVNALRTSKAFARNWAREAIGILKITRDVYGDVKPPAFAMQ